MTNNTTEPAQPLVLVVEDETKLARVLQDYLQQAGFQTWHLADGNAVLPWLADNQPEAIILDLMLPGLDGLSILRGLRQHQDTPVLVTTARVEELDRLLGLDLGADDYICKPYSPREVVARVRSVLRRSVAAPSATPGLSIDIHRHQASVHGLGVDLTPVEFRLLALLAATPHRVFSRNQMMAAAYSDGRVVSDRTMDTHVKNIRRKLDQAGANTLIEAVYGVGYRLVPPESGPATG